MSHGERALRLGIYCGLAAVKLKDDSFAQRFLGRSIREVSDAEYLEVTLEIQRRLVAAGVIGADEDPFEETVEGCLSQAEVRWMLE